MADHPDEAHAPSAPHVHGSMDIGEQVRTFDGFMRAAALTVVVVVAILLALTFRI